jgi:hypothetical protein
VRSIKMVSAFQDEVVVVHPAATLRFKNGEVKENISDEAAAVLLAKPEFVDALTGKNDLACADCGVPTTEIGYFHPPSAVNGNPPVMYYANKADERVCPSCFAKLEQGPEAVSQPTITPAAVAAPQED